MPFEKDAVNASKDRSFFDNDNNTVSAADMGATQVPAYEDQLPQDRQVQVQQQQQGANPAPQDAGAILERILNMSYESSKPKYDPKRPEELKRVGRLNTLGQGLSTIADMVSLASGGNVNKREKDTTNQGILKALNDYKDRHEDKLEQWETRDYLRKLTNLRTALGQKNLEDGRDTAAKYRDQDVEFRNKSFDASEAQRKTSNDMREQQFDWQKKLPGIQHGYRMEELDKRFNQAMSQYASKMKDDGKNTILYDDRGGQVLLREGEKDKVLSIILQDDGAAKEIDALKAEFGDGLSTNIKDYLVAKYWDKSPMVANYLQKRDGQQPSPATTTTGAPEQQPQQQQSAIDYGTIKF